MGSNPGWTLGYVPSPTEWNNQFGGKADEVSVLKYGADPTGVGNSTAAVQAAIAALPADGGRIHFPAGTYTLTCGQCSFPSGTTVSGDGTGTLIQCAAGGTTYLFDFSGSDPNTINTYSCLRDLFINAGNMTSGPIVRAYYNADWSMLNVHTLAAFDGVLHGAQLWDARIRDCHFDWPCWNTGSSCAAIWLRNSAANSGFGASADNTNEVHIIDCRFESFRGSAIRIERGTNNASNANNIRIRGCKFESAQLVSDPIIYLGAGTRACPIHENYIAADRWNTGTTPINGIYDVSDGGNFLDKLVFWGGISNVYANHIYLNTGSAEFIGDIVWSGAAPTGSTVNVAGGASPKVAGTNYANITGV